MTFAFAARNAGAEHAVQHNGFPLASAPKGRMGQPQTIVNGQLIQSGLTSSSLMTSWMLKLLDFVTAPQICAEGRQR
jgi:hypothetical protein